MSVSDPRLAWSVVFAPRRPEAEPPPWPDVVARVVGKVTLPAVDPVTHVLRGPFPVATLHRGRAASGVGHILSGTGPSVVLTLTDKEPGEVDGHLRLERMRARMAATLLGLEVPAAGRGTELEATPERLGALLREQFDGDDAWEVLGIVEAAAILSEGVPEDLPSVEGYQDFGDLRLARAVGVGAGHVAFLATGFHTRETERNVMERRLTVMTEGYMETVPPLAEFGSHALHWGAAASSGLRLSQALAGVIGDVRVGASWAVSGGPIESEPDFDRLAARLEVLRVRLKEVVGRLRRGRAALVRSASRLVGDEDVAPSSPLTEASVRGARLADRLAEEEELGGRWAEALAVARKNAV